MHKTRHARLVEGLLPPPVGEQLLHGRVLFLRGRRGGAEAARLPRAPQHRPLLCGEARGAARGELRDGGCRGGGRRGRRGVYGGGSAGRLRRRRLRRRCRAASAAAAGPSSCPRLRLISRGRYRGGRLARLCPFYDGGLPPAAAPGRGGAFRGRLGAAYQQPLAAPRRRAARGSARRARAAFAARPEGRCDAAAQRRGQPAAAVAAAPRRAAARGPRHRVFHRGKAAPAGARAGGGGQRGVGGVARVLRGRLCRRGGGGGGGGARPPLPSFCAPRGRCCQQRVCHRLDA
jgi:hypothetical protein